MSFLFKLFNNKSIEEFEDRNMLLKKQLLFLQEQLKEKDTLIEAHLSKKKIETIDYTKQWQVMEKNLRNLQNENKKLISTFIKLNKIIPKEQWKYSYKVELHYFYSSNKFVSIREKLQNLGIEYLQDINEQLFTTELKNERYVEEGYQKFLDYKHGIIEWNIKTLLIKGDKVTKIYQKYRKFLNILSNQNIEFMIELESFDFQTLINFDFTQENIDMLKQKYEKYNNERKI